MTQFMSPEQRAKAHEEACGAKEAESNALGHDLAGIGNLTNAAGDVIGFQVRCDRCGEIGKAIRQKIGSPELRGVVYSMTCKPVERATHVSGDSKTGFKITIHKPISAWPPGFHTLP